MMGGMGLQQAHFAEIERQKQAAEAARVQKQIADSTAIAPKNGKGYTITDKDLQGNPFETKYRTDSEGRYIGSPTDANGRPVRPEFTSIGDPKTGLLRPEYQLKDTLDRRGYDAMMGEALRPAGQQSKWAQMAQSQQLGQLAQQQAGQQAQAQNQLAMGGGLRSGARERLAAQGMQGGLAARQQTTGKINMQDEENRQKWLQMAPQAALQQASFDQGTQKYNLGMTMAELAQKRAYDAGVYGEAMKGWGAEKTANASGGGGGKK